MNDSEVIVLIGTGSIGQAIARRIGAGKQLILADLQRETAESVARVMSDAGFDVQAMHVDVTDPASVQALVHEATGLGAVTGLIHAAGVSPSNAPPAAIFKVDLYGTAVVLEAFSTAIAEGGSGLVVSSQAGHRQAALPPGDVRALATTPSHELLDLAILQPDQLSGSLQAYQIAKYACSLRVQAESVRWVRRGARLNAISPGIVMTPLARKELNGPHGQGYRRMIERCAGGRAATPDEIAALGAFLMGPEGRFISGSDCLIDGGVTAAYWYDNLDVD